MRLEYRSFGKLWGRKLFPLLGLLATCKSPSHRTGGQENQSGVEQSQPSGDELSLNGGVIDSVAAGLQNAGSFVIGPFVGGPTETYADAHVDIPQASMTSSAIPPGGAASPLFGAKPWTQKLLLFEEFGTERLTATARPVAFPEIVDSVDASNPEVSTPKERSAPDKYGVDRLIGEPGLNPMPTRTANTTTKNPWWTVICRYIGNPRCLTAPGPAEGRPPGEGWAHQRWNEFYPQRLMKTSQSGARMNLGVRDSKQMHQYRFGEFGPRGLYYNTVGTAGFSGTTRGIKPQFHPNFPVQNHQKLWTFDGTFPPKLLMARYGEPILFRHYNMLPVDVSANGGFGTHTISTHEHNGHNPSESDGYAEAFFFPGQYYDYRWPMAVAGHDTINVDATDPIMATPCFAGEVMAVTRKTGVVNVPCDVSKDPAGRSGNVKLRGDWREIMSSHWFHDHMVDFTSKNVYKGNAAAMNYYSAIDRGNESLNDGVNLRLPSGSSLPWGNRDYDVNLAVGDKAWDAKGQLWFNPFDTDGFLGDQVLVNMTWRPVLDVRARRYRFRILNASVARYYKLAVIREIAGTSGSIAGPSGSNLSYEPVVFHMIANDGNIMEQSVAFDGTLGTQKGILPTQGIAERDDIIVDFAKNGIKPGDKLYFVNTQEHTNGKLPNKQIPLQSIMNGSYQPVVGGNNYWTSGDPGVGMIMRLDVKACVDAAGSAVACADPSLDPSRYVQGNKLGVNGADLKMWTRAQITAADLAGAKHHTFEFVRGGGSGGTDNKPWAVKVDGNDAHTADMRRLSVSTNLGDKTANGNGKVQVWHISNKSGGWSHPVHVHFEEGQILSRGGKAPPIWEKYARKDMYRVGPEADSTGSVDLAIRIREFAGSYMEHCHNTTHEDTAMLVRWDSERPGQLQMMPAPSPSWYGVGFADSVAETTFRNGDPDFIKSTFVSLDGVVAPGQEMAVKGVGGNCSFKAKMQNDGNFVLYRGSAAIWDTKTAGKAPGGMIRFQSDGNLVLYKADGVTAPWNAGTHNRGAFEFVLDGTGRLMVKDKSGVNLWTSGNPVAGCSL